MTETKTKSINLIAPCGINCAVCRAHLRQRNPCPGCRADDADKPKTRVVCKIKTCEKLMSGGFEYCSACGDFPCTVVLHLDKRYRLKYATSPVQNLSSIQKGGLARFLCTEARKWTCPQCGGTLCMHAPECPSCGYRWNREMVLT